MKKSYVTPSILLLPLQIMGGPNAGVSPDKSGMQPIDAKEGGFDEDFDMNSGWFD